MPTKLQDPTEYCCLCIPVRFALLAGAMFLMLLSAVLGGLGILALERINGQLSEFQRLSILFHIVINIAFTCFCVMGIYASATKSVNLTSIYTSCIIGQIIFSIASGALLLYFLFNNVQAWNVANCLSIAFDPFTINLCQRTPVFKGLVVGSLSTLWVVEIVTIITGTSFLSQLREESMQLELVQPKYIRGGHYC